MNVVGAAIKNRETTLSEFESKKLLAAYGIPITREMQVRGRRSLFEATAAIGFPVVLKGSSPGSAHKTEKGLIRLDIRNNDEALVAFDEVIAAMGGKESTVLVQEMIRGTRELAAGMTRDPQFGPCVMFGLGGILTEILDDVSFRVAPLEKRDALAMMREIRGHRVLDAVRGMAAADLDKLAKILVAMGKIGLENEAIKEIDVNPMVLYDGKPVVVDALVVMK